MNDDELRQETEIRRARKALFELLWHAAHPATQNCPAPPVPILDDQYYLKYIRRVLGFKRPWWRCP